MSVDQDAVLTTSSALPPLDVRAMVSGGRFLVLGGTGFLGKVWLCMLLHHAPDVDHVYLVVRPRKRKDGSIRQSSEARFWAEVATSAVFDPLRERYPGAAFDAFMKRKITAIAGDVTEPYGGVSQAVRDDIRGTLSAIVNSAGVVDFNPPLDYALNVNAFGMKNLVQLAKDVGSPPFMHTSTCYVAGDRTGQVDEVHPFEFPFPKADKLDPSHWDPEREIAECVDLVDNVRHRSNDAFRQSHFLDQAKKNLVAKKEPARGSALVDELAVVKRKFEEKQLIDGGQERAKYWGWHNIYTYTKSIGEQILCGSGVPFTIVRPAVIESAVAFPRVGWCEGINTSAPLIHMAVEGPVLFPYEPDTVLDVIPVDHVAAGMMLSLAELLEGTAKVVYQYGSSDTAPLKVARMIELVGLYKRRHYKKVAGGNPLVNEVRSRIECIPVSVEHYRERGPKWRSSKVKALSGFLKGFGEGALKPLVDTATSNLNTLARGLEIQAYITDQFVPFMATHNYRFSCANTREALSRLTTEEASQLSWAPEDIDWRHYMLEVHGPGITRNVSPEIKIKMRKEKKALRPHDDLVALLDEAAHQHDLAPALLHTHPDGFVRTSYKELRGRSQAVAIRLVAAGVTPGDRVLLSGKNHPDWAACYFGILRAGAIAVPLDPALEPEKVVVILGSARACAAILDDEAEESFGAAVDAGGLKRLHLRQAGAMGAVGALPDVEISGDTVASILYTSGTTGDPKGVMLTHGNFTAMLSSLGRLFPLKEEDRLLSVLPLHHAFEFTCGLLLPISMGARIYYLDEISGDTLATALQDAQITCMVGVPALWQLLERRIRSQVKEKGQLFELAFKGGMDVNRSVGRATGFDLGRLMFGSVHSRFGGSIRMLISGGAALPRETHSLFSGLGLPLSEGYGLTEASPVLTVSLPSPGGKAGHVGKAVPGVEIRIEGGDDKGVGEVWARGPNVMAGYFGNADATESVLDADGWLHTGDMGRLDHRGRLILVGRAKEVVVAASGENIYLDDVEGSMGTIRYVKEYCLVGLDDPRGGERLGMLAVPDAEANDHLDRRELHDAATRAIRDAIEQLPQVQRPAVVHLVDADLPRTNTRKVQRKGVTEVLAKIVAATPTRRKGGGVAGPVAAAIASVAGVSADEVGPETRLGEAFGFDSLMYVELSSALENAGPGRPDAVALTNAATVADIVELVGATPPKHDSDIVHGEEDEIIFPEVVTERLKSAISAGQRRFNGDVLQTRVIGRANIPQNRQVIVVSNHTSHLDMGLVKFALGPYGKNIASLAAKDYFFEGNKYKVAMFRNFTNAEPIDRKSGFRTSMRQAMDVIEKGRVVLLFPEGTRQLDGQLAAFKPLVGKLSLESGVDILPLQIDGSYQSMPKGRALPTRRGITVRIGPALEIAELRRLTDGMKPAEAARKVAALSRLAVEELAKGGALRLSELEAEVEVAAAPVSPEELARSVFGELAGRYDPARMDRPLTWYFSLGGPRWTVAIDAESATVREGRPSGAADCVVKTTTDIFTRIVRDAYVPDVAEFMSGAIKTSDIPLLIHFTQVFALNGGAM